MNNLPPYVFAGATAVTFLTLFFLYRASGRSKIVLFVSLAWLGLQAGIGLSGFYAVTDSMPPRLALALLPPVMVVAVSFFTKSGTAFLDGFNTKWPTLLHVVRIPVEMMLLWLALHKYLPLLMTFEGRNFDLFSGVTAPLIFHFGYVKKTPGRNLLLGWNFLCLLLLINIVVNAILAAPFPFQQFAFDQPNIAVLYFPFVWLPAFIVPAVLFSHLVCIRELLTERRKTSPLLFSKSTTSP